MKKRRRYSPKRRVPSRRWHVPPPLVHGTEPLEGGGILEEWKDELGVVLWQAFRDVLLWATADPEERAEAFVVRADILPDPTELLPAGADPRLRTSIRVLRQLVTDPVGLRDEQVARACRQISDWAEDQGKLVTAFAFAQDAALTARRDPAAAFWVATLAVRLNDHPRAEVWFRRAVGLARQTRDWRMYSRAFGGLGNLYIRRGNLPAARRLHTRALRGARRGGMRREQATALHDLFAVAVETASISEAEQLARQALEAYGTRNRRVHVLAHDVAYFWMEQGHFARALPVFQAVLPLIERPVERLFVLANIARAAAGVSQVEIVEEIAAEVWHLALEADLRHGAGRALLEVGRGYVNLRKWPEAETAAAAALTSATGFRESKIQFEAEALLASIRHRQVSSATAHSGAADDPRTGDQLAADLVRTLGIVASGSTT